MLSMKAQYRFHNRRFYINKLLLVTFFRLKFPPIHTTTKNKIQLQLTRKKEWSCTLSSK